MDIGDLSITSLQANY